ncbi:maleylpyruvate isomerase family mycothiol-dependent enzyme [Streptomyces sp. NPDC059224]|uniref:maleylpyruvate isomerase family mycothiol-dependent enzyme n=1 Tax=Streptomyces sp. NPDC059224 TaxID=3346775 RepID=UPI0036AA0198
MDGWSEGAEAVYAILRRRRHALLELLNNIEESQFNTQSRCTDWSVHEVVRHVRDVAKVHISMLDETEYPFGNPRKFSPKTSPAAWMRHSEGESVKETVDELSQLIQREGDLFLRRAREGSTQVRQGPLGRKLHWSVFSTHTIWDAWMHERDICIPLGSDVPLDGEEGRLMVMYTLLAASAPAAWSGDYVETAIKLYGSPDCTYRIGHDNSRIYVQTGGRADVGGDMAVILDSLAGRGPELSEILGSSSEAVRKLSLLRVVAT